jgi:Ca2+/Na+ antiporter
MSTKSVICLLFGIAFVLVPAQIISLYGASLTEGDIFMTRLFGASFVLLGLWLGLDRNTQEVESRRAVAISVAIGDVLGCAIMVYALLTGVINALGWVNAVIYLLFAIGFAYVLVSEPEGKLAI